MEHVEGCKCESCVGLLSASCWRWFNLVEYGLKLNWRMLDAVTKTSEDLLDDVLRHQLFVIEQKKFQRDAAASIEKIVGG